MTRTEMELTLVLNAADGDEGYCLASSTWPQWTRFFDKLVAAGIATSENIRDSDGRRLGGRYKINARVLRIGARTKPRGKRAVSEAERAALGARLARARAARSGSSQKIIEPENKNTPSQPEP
jgi:hypothetical protein